jgi:hypothetical protein
MRGQLPIAGDGLQMNQIILEKAARVVDRGKLLGGKRHAIGGRDA